MIAKDDNTDFIKAKDLIYGNLEDIRLSLILCVDEGMMDLEDSLYNHLLDLIDDNAVLRTWDEMQALIDRAKILEQDIDAWLAMHGRTTISLTWPNPPKKSK